MFYLKEKIILIAAPVLLLPALFLILNIGVVNSKEAVKQGGAKKNILKWERPKFSERQKERNRMVSYQIERGSIPIKDKDVLEAMRNVPRHLFVPKYLWSAAYADSPLPIGYSQTISQPFIVAYMTELLKIAPGDKVLEIGTGSGYQAAILSELTPHVYSIEIIKELGKSAKERFKKIGYKTIKVKIGDGYYGWEEYAPFDAVIVTAAAGHVPPPLIKQLKPGGRIIIPVGGIYETHILVLITKSDDGKPKTKHLIPVRFVPLTGRAQE